MDTEYRLTAQLLETMGMAFCVFDAEDRTVLWNQAFLRYFPEHEGHVHVGEHYGENLRRFYRSRLNPAEIAQIERYVSDGVNRARTQTQPYVFQHRNRWFRVSSLPEPGGGRVRVWLKLSLAEAQQLQDAPPDHSPENLHLLPWDDASSMLQTLGEGVTLHDAQQRIVGANDQFLQTYGMGSEASVLGRTLWEVVDALWEEAGDAGQRGLYADDFAMARHYGSGFSGSAVELVLPAQRWTRVNLNRTVAGQVYALHWDISAVKRHEFELRLAERRARESESRLRSVAAALRIESARAKENEQRTRDVFIRSGMPTLLAAPDGRLLDVNDALCELLGHRRENLLRLCLGDVVERHAAQDILQDLQAPAAGGAGGSSRLFDLETAFYRRDGSAGACQFSCAAVFDADGSCHQVVGHLLDITRRKSEDQAREQMVDTLRREASQDELTGLVNRRQLETELQELVREPGRHGLLFIDLDGFKLVNDRAGHAYGDVVLRQVASLLRRTVRASDTVGRLGGDEFVVLLRDCDADRVVAVAGNLVRVLGRSEFGVSDRLYRIGASVGLRLFGDRRETMDEILRDADAACYRAKRNGRNRVEAHLPI
ncbi:diguanylate cyclase [Xylophilus sp. Kf1]|nr:diguanylate cyclase [Xylophilus sp. Kf1]